VAGDLRGAGESHSARYLQSNFRRRAFVVFEGGLGNQLFEFAAAASAVGVRGVRLIDARPTPYATLETAVPGLVRRVGAVDQWRLGTKFAGASGWRGFMHRALKSVRSRVARRTLRPDGDLDHAFDPRPAGLARPMVFDGYFQHPDWFEPARAQIVDRLLDVAPPTLRRGLSRDEEVVVVVRGGDYVDLGWQLPIDYYERAIREFGRSCNFRIVTDDQSRGDEVSAALVRGGWTRSNSESNTTATDDFWAIVGTRRVVMANSTFCWWAATVGDQLFGPTSPDRLVVFPEHWILGHGWVLAQPMWRAVASGTSFVGK